MVEQSTAASHSLAQEADELARLLRRFRTGHREAAPARAAAPARLAPPARRALPPGEADSKGSAFAQRHSAPQLRSPGGRGLSTAPQPADDWEEF